MVFGGDWPGWMTRQRAKRIDATGKMADISTVEARSAMVRGYERCRTRHRSGRRGDRRRPRSPGGNHAPGMAVMMDRMHSALIALRSDESGATAIEYALIIAFISITVVSWATFVGQSISGFFMQVANGI